MTTVRRITFCAAVLLVLAATTTALADANPCDKNHYILLSPSPCGIPATDAAIGAPGAVAADTRGNVYFSSPNIVFKVDPKGFLTRVAGNGRAGYSGDGGAATKALLSFPATYPELEHDPIDFEELIGALAIDAMGNLYIADAYNNRVRKVDSDGTITTVAGNGNRGDTTEDGLAINARFWWPQGVAVDSSGNLFIADGSGSLRRVAPDGLMTTASGRNNCGNGFLLPGLCAPEGIAVDGQGNVFVADGYCRIRKVGVDGDIKTIAGKDSVPDAHGWAYTCDYSGDGGPAINASLLGPFGVATDSIGNLFIADTYNHCVRKVDAESIITTVAGICSNYWKREISRGFAGDGGPATDAHLNTPHGVAVDAEGTIYIADTGNNRIRKVSPDGIITTIAGDGKPLPLPRSTD